MFPIASNTAPRRCHNPCVEGMEMTLEFMATDRFAGDFLEAPALEMQSDPAYHTATQLS